MRKFIVSKRKTISRLAEKVVEKIFGYIKTHKINYIKIDQNRYWEDTNGLIAAFDPTSLKIPKDRLWQTYYAS